MHEGSFNFDLVPVKMNFLLLIPGRYVKDNVINQSTHWTFMLNILFQNIDKEMDKAVSGMNGKTIGTGSAVSSAQSSLNSLTILLSGINYNAVDTVVKY